MTTGTATTTDTAGFSLGLVVPVFVAALMGLAIITVAGHAQPAVLHDAAHDVRHATGFPCH